MIANFPVVVHRLFMRDRIPMKARSHPHESPIAWDRYTAYLTFSSSPYPSRERSHNFEGCRTTTTGILFYLIFGSPDRPRSPLLGPYTL
ncbi:MAG: hypothetical protein GDA56_29815 [Hormoscilla sp. GM7CHS1pb]|nr:hypothetical protein [Hormoscilla sp. GM7CHS1pb]